MAQFREKRRIDPSPPHLPSELVFDHILPRLAAEPLLRFSSVSKLWCTTIADPKFVSSHFLYSKENPHLAIMFEDRNDKEKHLILNFGTIINIEGEEGDGSQAVGSNRATGLFPNRFTSKSSKEKEKRDGPVVMDVEKLKKVSITGPYRRWVGSCNGLICFRSNFGFANPNDRTQEISVFEYGIEITNPSTREVLLVPLPKENRTGLSHYGFGYTALSNEYKLVCVSNSNKYVMVYTLGTNSWRSIPVPTHMPDHFFYVEEIPLCLDGTLYWYTIPNNTCELLIFDIHEEKFQMIPTPARGLQDHQPMFQLEGQLCFTTVNGEFVTLHTLKKDRTKQCWGNESIRLPPGDGNLFNFGGDGVDVFLDQVLLHWGRPELLTLYNLRTGTKKEVKLLPNFLFFEYQVLTYVENLLSLQTLVPPGESEVVCVSSTTIQEEKIKDEDIKDDLHCADGNIKLWQNCATSPRLLWKSSQVNVEPSLS